MSPRSPTPILIVDTNIVLGAVFGRSDAFRLSDVAMSRSLICSRDMVIEAAAVVDRVLPGEERAAVRLIRSFQAIEVVERHVYVPKIEAAQRSLRLAPASRNGSEKDAHVLALAWTYDADIWSHDRDFAGTGWPSWSSANLAAALSEEAAAPAVER
ncbi:hypothetical protein ASE63_13345 [Bosea sp. Root381]|uniref:PIN domain-containing protein n=1 Tax=Bosea sp. Root381 TaxID=1736524 RepID=UPI0006FBE7E3|nr:PIN domain-containing protein [Bosea sp. Root381]KRE17432.1 hypothetical protein ASE63_13345 [Bosea sp. Root381]